MTKSQREAIEAIRAELEEEFECKTCEELELQSANMKRAIAVGEAALPPADPLLADVYTWLVWILGELSAEGGEVSRDEMADLVLRALAIDEKHGRQYGYPVRSHRYWKAAEALQLAGRLEESEAFWRRAIHEEESVNPIDYRVLGLCIHYLGEVLEKLGRLEEARDCQMRFLRIREDKGEDFRRLAVDRMDLARLHRRLGEEEAARSHLDWIAANFREAQKKNSLKSHEELWLQQRWRRLIGGELTEWGQS